MTTDRDVRLTISQVSTLQDAARRRRWDLERSIKRAEAARADGRPYQRGTLDRHLAERATLAECEAILQVAADAHVRRVKDNLAAALEREAE